MSDTDSEISGASCQDDSIDMGFDLSDIQLSSASEDNTISSDSEDDVQDVPGNVFRDELTPIVLEPFTGPTGLRHLLDDTALELEYFQLLFTDDMLENIVIQTNLYAEQCIANKPDAL